MTSTRQEAPSIQALAPATWSTGQSSPEEAPASLVRRSRQRAARASVHGECRSRGNRDERASVAPLRMLGRSTCAGEGASGAAPRALEHPCALARTLARHRAGCAHGRRREDSQLRPAHHKLAEGRDRARGGCARGSGCRRASRRRVSRHTAVRPVRSSWSERFASVICCFYTRDFWPRANACETRLRGNRFESVCFSARCPRGHIAPHGLVGGLTTRAASTIPEIRRRKSYFLNNSEHDPVPRRMTQREPWVLF